MAYTDFARLSLSILAVLAVVAMIVRINDDWPRLSMGWVITRFSMVGLLGVFAYGPIELMTVEPTVPLGLRVYFAAMFLAGLIVGLFLVRHEMGNHAGWIAADEVQAILDEVESAHALGCNPPAPGCLIARDRMREAVKKARKEVASAL